MPLKEGDQSLKQPGRHADIIGPKKKFDGTGTLPGRATPLDAGGDPFSEVGEGMRVEQGWLIVHVLRSLTPAFYQVAAAGGAVEMNIGLIA